MYESMIEMHIPENVKLWESPGRAGGSPNCKLLNNFNALLVFVFCIDKTTASDSINPIELPLCKGVCELAARLKL